MNSHLLNLISGVVVCFIGWIMTKETYVKRYIKFSNQTKGVSTTITPTTIQTFKWLGRSFFFLGILLFIVALLQIGGDL